MKLNMKYVFILLAALSLPATGQNFNAEYLLGTWELESEESEGEVPSDMMSIIERDQSSTESKNKSVQEVYIYFQDENMVDIMQNGSQYKSMFGLKDSVLYIGSSQYTVLSLTKSELIYKEDEEKLWPKTFRFVRSAKEIEPMPKKEIVEETYPNGNKKLMGVRELGFKAGIWTEWHPNGAVKSVTHFNNEVLLMIIEFDTNGDVINKRRINFQVGTYTDN